MDDEIKKILINHLQLLDNQLDKDALRQALE